MTSINIVLYSNTVKTFISLERLYKYSSAEFKSKVNIELVYVPCEDNRKKPDRGSLLVHSHLDKLKDFFISSQ